MGTSWNFRRSIRLPGGLRINLSRRGVGYSVGVPGARFGKDATGRQYQAYSVPGAGLYSRKYSPGEAGAPNETGSFWKWFGVGMVLGFLGGGGRKRGGGGCIGLLILLAIPVLLLGYFASFIAQASLPLLVEVAILVFAFFLFRTWHFEIERQPQTPSGPQGTSVGAHDPHLRREAVGLAHGRTPTSPLSSLDVQRVDCSASPEATRPTAVPEGASSVEFQHAPTVGGGGRDLQTGEMDDFLSKFGEAVDAVSPVLKEALRPVRMASSVRTLLELEFQNVIYGFGLDATGCLSFEAASLYAGIFARLNRRLAGVTPQIVQATSREYITAHIADLEAFPEKPEIIRHLQSWDRLHGTSFARVLRDLLVHIAVLAAAENGSVPEVKSRRVEALAAAMDSAA
jgi:hypothetical protein